MSNSKTIIGNNIYVLRKERNLTQSKLGEILTVDKSTVSSYESGRIEPPLDIVMKLSEHFSVSSDFLLGRTDCRFEINRLNELLCDNITLGHMIECYLKLDCELQRALLTIIMKHD